MKIHEYQAKQVMAAWLFRYPGRDGPDSCRGEGGCRQPGTTRLWSRLRSMQGPGKGGGIKTADSPARVETLAKAMLGSKLVTPQTGARKDRPQGAGRGGGGHFPEMYFGITVDRARECAVIIASKEGEWRLRNSPGRPLKRSSRSGSIPASG